MPRHPAIHRPQRGQATVEFLVALMVMVPMFFGMYYFARYADIKHSAIQASRYVAFERATDPQSRAKNATQLAEETRVRFFTPISRNEGRIAYLESAANLNANSGRIPLWSDADYKPLLRQFSDIGIHESRVGNLNRGVVGRLQNVVARPVFKLPTGGVYKAEVTVPLNNIAHFEVLRDINVGMPGATAIGIGAWNASGARDGPQSVCGHVNHAVIGGYIEPVMDVLGVLMSPFESVKPDVGRNLPDYVPPGSVRNAAGNNIPYNQQNGNRC